MNELKNFLSPVFFVIVIICFFLPFFNLTCQQQKIASLTGFELMTGTTIKTNENINGSNDMPLSGLNKGIKSESVSAEPLALIVFLMAIGGLILSFYKKYSDLGPAIAALLGVVSLIFLSSVVTDDLLGRAQYQPLAVECTTGYYISLIFFVAALFYNAYLFAIRISYKPADTSTIEDKMRFCPKCGAINDLVSLYCNKCGAKMEVEQT
jgi:ribosomal protein S27AE